MVTYWVYGPSFDIASKFEPTTGRIHFAILLRVISYIINEVFCLRFRFGWKWLRAGNWWNDPEIPENKKEKNCKAVDIGATQ